MINKVILVGNLGQDPEMRYTPGGTGVCSFSVATNERWTGKDGSKQEKTQWHRIVVWGKLGELCSQYLTKGRTVYIEGRIEYRDWNDKEGNKRTSTEIIASNVQFLGGGAGKGPREAGETPRASSSAPASSNQDNLPEFEDEDIPF